MSDADVEAIKEYIRKRFNWECDIVETKKWTKHPSVWNDRLRRMCAQILYHIDNLKAGEGDGGASQTEGHTSLS